MERAAGTVASSAFGFGFGASGAPARCISASLASRSACSRGCPRARAAMSVTGQAAGNGVRTHVGGGFLVRESVEVCFLACDVALEVGFAVVFELRAGRGEGRGGGRLVEETNLGVVLGLFFVGEGGVVGVCGVVEGDGGFVLVAGGFFGCRVRLERGLHARRIAVNEIETRVTGQRVRVLYCTLRLAGCC